MRHFPDKKYRIVYADPPWYFDQGIRSGCEDDTEFKYYTPETTPGGKYRMQTTEWICDLPVRDISLPNAVLFLWTTDAHLEQAIQVMNAWGFKYKTVAFYWNKKTSKNKQVCYYGHWTMKGTETCLLGTRGRPHVFVTSHRVRQLVEARRRGHSQKPDEVRRRIVELMGDESRIELFARERHEGWDAWGDEIA